MKITRKVLVALLSLALIASCFALSVSAAYTDPVTEENYDEVLGYFDDRYYVQQNFADVGNIAATAPGSITAADFAKMFGETTGFTAGATGDAAKLQIASGQLKVLPTNGAKVNFDIAQAEKESFGVNGTLKLGIKNNTATVSIVLMKDGAAVEELASMQVQNATVGGTKNTSSVIAAATTVFTFNAHYLLNGDGTALFTLNVVGGSGTTETYTYNPTTTDYDGFRIVFGASRTGYTVDALEAYPGDVMRTGADNTVVIAEYLKTLANAIDAAESDEIKTKYANVIYSTVSEYGYDVSKIADATLKAEAEAAIVKAKNVIGGAYINPFVEGAKAIDATASYSVRLAYYKTLAEYDTLVELVYADQEQEIKTAIDEARAAVAEEKAAIELIASNTVDSVQMLLALDVKAANYAELKKALADLEAKPIAPDYTDDTYTAENVAEAIAVVDEINAELTARNSTVLAFANALAAAAKPDGEETASAFAARYEAYVAATANYFDDVTYNEFAEENYVEGLLEAYDTVAAEMAAEAAAAKALNDKVEYAANLGAIYVKAYLEAIAADVAAANVGYPGVADTVARYNELVAASNVVNGDDIIADLLTYCANNSYALLPNALKYFVNGSFGIDIVVPDAEGVAFTVVVNADTSATVVSFENGVVKVGDAVVAEGLTTVDIDVFVAKVGENYVAYVSVNGDTVNVTSVALDGEVTGVTATSTDDLLIYEADFVRNPESNDEIAEYICAAVDLYDAAGNANEENYLNWIEVIYNSVINGFGFNTDVVIDAELAAKADAAVVRVAQLVGNYYVQKLISDAAKIDVNAAYENRLSFVATLAGYMEYIEEIEEEYVVAGKFTFDVEADTLDNAKTAYYAEEDLLVTIAEQTKTAIDAIGKLPEILANATYKELIEAIEVLNENPIDVTFYDETVDTATVENAYNVAKNVYKRFALVDAQAKAFVENVLAADNTNVGDDESGDAFRARYAAYLAAKLNYFADETYDDYIEGEYTVAGLLAIYASVETEMVAEIENARAVIGAIAAAAPLNFYSKAETVAALEELVKAANLKFPGVKEAVDAYNVLVEFVNAKSIERLALEFVEIYEGKKYLSDNFDATEVPEWIRNVPAFDYVTDEVAFNKSSAFAYKVVDGVITFRNLSTAHIDVTPENAGSFGINLSAKLSAADDSIALSIYEGARENSDSIELIVIEAGKVTVYTADGAQEYESAITANTMFTVSAYYEATVDGGKLSVTVSVDGADDEIYFVTVDNFNYKAFDLAVTEVAIDYIDIYAGSFNRSAPNVAELTAKYINDIVAAYTADNNVNFLNDLARIITYNDLAIDTIADEELKAATVASINTALTVVGNDYAAKIVAGAAEVDVTKDYNVRLDHYNAMMTLDEILAFVQNNYAQSVEITVSSEDIEAARAALTAEKALLDTAKLNTFVSYEAAIKVPNLLLANYKDLRDAYDTFTAYPICASFYDETLTAQNVADTLALINAITEAYLAVNKQVESFYANVAIADNRNVPADETDEAFALRYAAYVEAKNLYFTDESYDEYLPEGAVSVADILAVYDLINAEMLEAIALAEEFIAIVKEANLTASYSVKKLALVEAAALINAIERGYPGIVETIALYNAINSNIVDKEAAAKAYIEAVLAIANATDYASKKAAVAAAKTLAAAGSDVSVDVSVNGVNITQANILFSDAESELLLLDIRVENFVSAVNAIKNATSLEAKKAAIVKALSFKEKADAANASVITATSELNKAIEDYNASVAAANAAMESAVEVMASAVVKTVPTKPAAQVVAIIKKFFD